MEVRSFCRLDDHVLSSRKRPHSIPIFLFLYFYYFSFIPQFIIYFCHLSIYHSIHSFFIHLPCPSNCLFIPFCTIYFSFIFFFVHIHFSFLYLFLLFFNSLFLSIYPFKSTPYFQYLQLHFFTISLSFPIPFPYTYIFHSPRNITHRQFTHTEKFRNPHH